MSFPTDFEYLKPYLQLRLSDDRKYYHLFILFRKDAENQVITIGKTDEAPDYPNTMRVIRITAKHIAQSPDFYFFKDLIKIPVGKRASHEMLIKVIVEHDHSNHGGTGTVHYPPPPNVGP